MRTTEEDKAEWVRAAVREHQGALLRYATVLLGDLDRAQDVVQETFIRLCGEKPERLANHLSEWLFTVCRHRAVDVLRKEGRMKPLDEVLLQTHPSGEPSPAAQAAEREDAGRVEQFMASLPMTQQEVVRLKFQNGLSYKEISRIMNLSVSNVGFLLHTALKTLRHRMQPAPRAIQP